MSQLVAGELISACQFWPDALCFSTGRYTTRDCNAAHCIQKDVPEACKLPFCDYSVIAAKDIFSFLYGAPVSLIPLCQFDGIFIRDRDGSLPGRSFWLFDATPFKIIRLHNGDGSAGEDLHYPPKSCGFFAAKPTTELHKRKHPYER